MVVRLKIRRNKLDQVNLRKHFMVFRVNDHFPKQTNRNVAEMGS